jgi:hypothetical protein
VLLPLLVAACTRQVIFDDVPSDNVYVKIHWDGLVPGYSMHIQLFPEQGGAYMSYPLGAHGGAIWLSPGVSYASVCFDYEGMEYLDFRNMHSASLFEAYNEPAALKTAVHESYPYTFYATRNTPSFTAPAEGLDTLHCYPRNALHEFTYLIHGVEGAKNVSSSRGTISGMSGSYYLSSGALSDTPSTVLFCRSLALVSKDFITDTLQCVPVPGYGSIPVYPKWFPSETSWKGDWVIGAFSVFGLVSDNQLTVECFSHANYRYSASWGWQGEVTAQIMGSLGYWDGCPANVEKGSPEAQTAWRKHNGGFDIILANEGRLVIPPDVGLNAPVSGWDGVEIPLH